LDNGVFPIAKPIPSRAEDREGIGSQRTFQSGVRSYKWEAILSPATREEFGYTRIDITGPVIDIDEGRPLRRRYSSAAVNSTLAACPWR
jgi:hypothetical protein